MSDRAQRGLELELLTVHRRAVQSTGERHEAPVRDPETERCRLIGCLELPWNPAC